MKLRTDIKGLDVSTILHPADKSTMDNLKKIPGFKTIVDKTVGSIMEKYAAVEYSGEGINVSPNCLPTLNAQIKEACRLLDMQEVPACSINWFYHIGSFSVGEKSKRIVFPSGSIDLLTAEELNFLIGHELGHMKCGHKTYHMLTEAMYRPMVGTDMELIVSLIRMPLLNWYRVSDFTLCIPDDTRSLNTSYPTMYRILFICSGNMYRSAGAEFILRKKLTEAGIEGWTVDSAGTLQLGHASLVLSQQVTATPCAKPYIVKHWAKH